MKEMIDARKQMNQVRIDKLDKERFEYATKIKEEAEDKAEKVHAEFKSVADSMAYAKQRRLNWRKQSLKTTNDELWTENMPAYQLSETDPTMRANMEKEYRMAKAKGGDDKKEEKKDEEKKDEKKEEKKEEKAEAKNATKGEEKKEEKKLSEKD